MRKSSATHALALALTLAPAAVAQQPPAPPPAKPNEEKPPAPTEAAPPADARPKAPAPPPAAAPEADDAEAPAEPPPSAAPPVRPADAQPGAEPPPSLTPMPMWPEPGSDATALKKQGGERPGAAAKKTAGDQVFAEDWWSHARPIFELHGYFRVRAELFLKGRYKGMEEKFLKDRLEKFLIRIRLVADRCAYPYIRQRPIEIRDAPPMFAANCLERVFNICWAALFCKIPLHQERSLCEDLVCVVGSGSHHSKYFIQERLFPIV